MLTESLLHALFVAHEQLCPIKVEITENQDYIYIYIILAIFSLLSISVLIVLLVRRFQLKKLSPEDITREGKLKFLNYYDSEVIESSNIRLD